MRLADGKEMILMNRDDSTEVWKGMKLGDVDPRRVKAHCNTISDKARAISGGILQAVVEHFNG
jgi:xanthine dehydrogenase accessory factor